ncbi:MAG: hypothetical protein RLY86_2232 [Pseudomonadota bacterium]|jgi:glycosyltransferase involved in cell wall biosynthesis
MTTEILLATWNGARFLPALIASLEAQTERSFRVLVRDDGSTDGTQAILADWVARDHRVHLLPADHPSGSAKAAFSRLMAHSGADHVLFADQDDVWAPEKVALTLQALQAGESRVGGSRPVLAFCDLSLIDAQGALIADSFRRYRRMDVRRGTAFRYLLLDNVVTGCAMGVNRSAIQHSAPVPDAAMMHDWWLALVCAGLGTVVPMEPALIGYRQHGANSVGAAPYSPWAAIRTKLASLRLRGDQHVFNGWYGGVQAQAAAFQQRFGSSLAPIDAQALAAFVRLRRLSPGVRRWAILRHGLYRTSLVRTLGLLLRI